MVKKQQVNTSTCDMPLAAQGLHSYRYRSPYGWIMIGAKGDEEALREARRSTDYPVVLENLQRHDGSRYVPVAQKKDEAQDTVTPMVDLKGTQSSPDVVEVDA